MNPDTDPRLSAPSALRNRDVILAVLRAQLPKFGTVLEVASGTGEHVVHFARHLPDLLFLPSDPDLTRRESIDAWAGKVANIQPALALDVSGAWPALEVDAVVCINMIHIAPWAATEGLLQGAASVLKPNGVLIFYGPYRQDGVFDTPSNEAFDADLRARDPAWGIRNLEDVASLAAIHGFSSPAIVAMPADNLCVVLHMERQPDGTRC